MTDGYELIGEILYGHDLSFEEVSELETILCEQLEVSLEELEPSFLDIKPMGDDLSFTSSVNACLPGDLRQACEQLSERMPPGAKGRLVAVTRGFGPVYVWIFTAMGVEEIDCQGQV